ncbi:MAG: hypothetical protein JRN42_04515 [Nitrososphaerota archaeon]|nr:hypothetical protein [Nitrososphaerota archaeon]
MAGFVPLPDDVVREVAAAAQEFIREAAPQRTGVGAESITVEALPGSALKVTFGRKYMYYQWTGIRPFVMRNLLGKTVPIAPGRFVHVGASNAPGTHRITARGPDGRISVGNSPIRWRHPGLRPNPYVERGIRRAVRKNAVHVVAAVVEEGSK